MDTELRTVVVGKEILDLVTHGVLVEVGREVGQGEFGRWGLAKFELRFERGDLIGKETGPALGDEKVVEGIGAGDKVDKGSYARAFLELKKA